MGERGRVIDIWWLSQATGKPAAAYSWWYNRYGDMDEFGVGISLYFRQLIFLSIIFLIAGVGSVTMHD